VPVDDEPNVEGVVAEVPDCPGSSVAPSGSVEGVALSPGGRVWLELLVVELLVVELGER
jgi:hypothetical protein